MKLRLLHCVVMTLMSVIDSEPFEWPRDSWLQYRRGWEAAVPRYPLIAA